VAGIRGQVTLEIGGFAVCHRRRPLFGGSPTPAAPTRRRGVVRGRGAVDRHSGMGAPGRAGGSPRPPLSPPPPERPSVFFSLGENCRTRTGPALGRRSNQKQAISLPWTVRWRCARRGSRNTGSLRGFRRRVPGSKRRRRASASLVGTWLARLNKALRHLYSCYRTGGGDGSVDSIRCRRAATM